MKKGNSRFFIIFAIIAGALLLSTLVWFGVKVGPGVKEGIIFSDLSRLKTILNETTASNMHFNLNAMNEMNVTDEEFNNVLKDESITEEEKIAKLKIYVGALLKGVIKNKKLSDIRNQDITVDENIINSAYNVRV